MRRKQFQTGQRESGKERGEEKFQIGQRELGKERGEEQFQIGQTGKNKEKKDYGEDEDRHRQGDKIWLPHFLLILLMDNK